MWITCCVFLVLQMRRTHGNPSAQYGWSGNLHRKLKWACHCVVIFAQCCDLAMCIAAGLQPYRFLFDFWCVGVRRHASTLCAYGTVGLRIRLTCALFFWRTGWVGIDRWLEVFPSRREFRSVPICPSEHPFLTTVYPCVWVCVKVFFVVSVCFWLDRCRLGFLVEQAGFETF